jgi:hypothetical protein
MNFLCISFFFANFGILVHAIVFIVRAPRRAEQFSSAVKHANRLSYNEKPALFNVASNNQIRTLNLIKSAMEQNTLKALAQKLKLCAEK